MAFAIIVDRSNITRVSGSVFEGVVEWVTSRHSLKLSSEPFYYFGRFRIDTVLKQNPFGRGRVGFRQNQRVGQVPISWHSLKLGSEPL